MMMRCGDEKTIDADYRHQSRLLNDDSRMNDAVMMPDDDDMINQIYDESIFKYRIAQDDEGEEGAIDSW